MISILLENEAGALSRVANLFSARGYNIESLSVAPTDDETLSRLTLVTYGNEQIVEQIVKQLNKLIDVVKLIDLSETEAIERELMLVKTKANGELRAEMKRLADIFGGHVLDVTDATYTIELTGTGTKLDNFLRAIERDAILEVVRSGATGIALGQKALHA
ncbi:MAG: acetolactate synthase small subunit [Candidatus Competibacteraceae bacterium]|nr:acetolactate synthase small subunit [Candidatus Competibacteraceae bacterium]MBK8896069.1 acetolactate synthase small subunit [Candidatus Competibacteraceae bacterium]MBK8963515.1 acetolactate synthase small subunit [Candidatus Competibacteraceae bacterium]